MTELVDSTDSLSGLDIEGIDKALVESQLGQILKQAPFSSSRRLSEMLVYIVEETLSGRGSRIKQYSIAVAVFGRDESFDPQADPIVRICAGRLRRALDAYYKVAGSNDRLLISIPLGRYEAQFQLIEAKERRKEALPPSVDRAPSMVILPFVDQSVDRIDDYVLSGMVEELSAEIALFPDFRVLTCGYSQDAKKYLDNPGQLAMELGVDFALVGTVRVLGDSVRLTLHLYRAESNDKVWSHRSERQAEGKSSLFADFKMVRSLASHVADTFGAVRRIQQEDARLLPRTEPSVFHALLAFYHYQLTMDPGDFTVALQKLETGYQLDPDNPAVNAKLGMMYLDAHVYGFEAREDALEQGQRLAWRARQLDPLNQQAQFTMAWASMIRSDVDGMLKAASRMLEINSNSAFMTGAAAFFFAVAGDYQKAKALFDKSVDLNPFYPSWFHMVPFLWAFDRQDYTRALEEAREFMVPGFYWSHVLSASALAKAGDIENSKKCYKLLLECRPEFEASAESMVRSIILDASLAEDMLSGIELAAKAG